MNITHEYWPAEIEISTNEYQPMNINPQILNYEYWPAKIYPQRLTNKY